MRLNAPSKILWLIALVLGILGILGVLGVVPVPYATWLLIGAVVLLLVGTAMRGL